MAGSITRRPLPALISLVALLLLTALVWWRVMNRDDTTSAAAKPCPAASTSASAAAAPRTLPPPRTIDVLVLNATTRSGIATKARATLLADGFRATRRATNDDLSTNKVTGQGQIRFDAAKKPAALLLQYYFPGAQLTQVSAASEQVTVSLGPKYTSVQPQKTVAARLAADKVTLTTAAATPSPSASPSC